MRDRDCQCLPLHLGAIVFCEQNSYTITRSPTPYMGYSLLAAYNAVSLLKPPNSEYFRFD